MAAPFHGRCAVAGGGHSDRAPAWAQKQGGVLRITHRDSPFSMSIHEEGTISVVMPMMGVFNNLVMFDQHDGRTASTASCPTSPTSGRGARTARR